MRRLPHLLGLAATLIVLIALPAAAATVSVSAEDSVFVPATKTVAAGTTVKWTNEGTIEHTVTADDGSFDSGTLAAGATYSRSFSKAGTYRYYCTFHGGPGGAGMAGRIIVKAAATSSTTKVKTQGSTGALATTAAPLDLLALTGVLLLLLGSGARRRYVPRHRRPGILSLR